MIYLSVEYSIYTSHVPTSMIRSDIASNRMTGASFLLTGRVVIKQMPVRKKFPQVDVNIDSYHQCFAAAFFIYVWAIVPPRCRWQKYFI